MELRIVRYISAHNGKRVRAYRIYFGDRLWDATMSAEYVRELIANERTLRRSA